VESSGPSPELAETWRTYREAVQRFEETLSAWSPPSAESDSDDDSTAELALEQAIGASELLETMLLEPPIRTPRLLGQPENNQRLLAIAAVDLSLAFDALVYSATDSELEALPGRWEEEHGQWAEEVRRPPPDPDVYVAETRKLLDRASSLFGSAGEIRGAAPSPQQFADKCIDESLTLAHSPVQGFLGLLPAAGPLAGLAEVQEWVRHGTELIAILDVVKTDIDEAEESAGLRIRARIRAFFLRFLRAGLRKLLAAAGIGEDKITRVIARVTNGDVQARLAKFRSRSFDAVLGKLVRADSARQLVATRMTRKPARPSCLEELNSYLEDTLMPNYTGEMKRAREVADVLRKRVAVLGLIPLPPVAIAIQILLLLACLCGVSYSVIRLADALDSPRLALRRNPGIPSAVRDCWSSRLGARWRP
jgi:hypothetical protein